ncbi:uncharacterized protein BDV17DRAFT_248831 [Aspergillus undulatus]|uniref:uncharacterized protein n=1 Tax=Aspergillus undulatus TaxID=1810928 RepID=UPI003CCCD6F3
MRFDEMGDKEPDGSWHPTEKAGRGRSTSNGWPSAVLEVEYSDSDSDSGSETKRKQKLHSDLQYWAKVAGGNVKVVFAMWIASDERRITINKWAYDEDIGSNTSITDNDKGADGTGHGRGGYILQEQVLITKSPKGKKVDVVGAPLTIGFEQLFLRPPRLRSEDKRIEIPQEDLEFLADSVWDMQRERRMKKKRRRGRRTDARRPWLLWPLYSLVFIPY